MLDLEGLPDLAEALVRLGGGHVGALITRGDGDSVSLLSELRYNTDKSAEKAWLERFAHISPLLPLVRRGKPGEVMTASRLVASESYQKSEFYNEWAIKRDHLDFVGLMLRKESGIATYFAMFRPRSAGLVSQPEIESMKIVAPHIKRAYLISDLLGEYKTEIDALGDMIANAGFGTILAAQDGKILYANHFAETLMRFGHDLSARQGRVVATDFKAGQKLAALIASAANPSGGRWIGGSMILPDHDGRGSYVVHVVPVSQQNSRRIISYDNLAAGIFILDRRSGADDRISGFARLFGLSPTETRVLSELISGEGLPRAVERLAMTEPTARTHLRNILAKTGTHRQAELMRLFFEVTIPGQTPKR